MLELFFDSNGIVHIEFIPGATVNKTCYKEILGSLRDSIRRKRPEIWRREELAVANNAPEHRSVLIQEEFPRQQVNVFPHPPYSPDLAHAIFSLSPHETTSTWV